VPFIKKKKKKKNKTLYWKCIEGSSKVTYLSYPFCLNLSMKEGSLFCFVVMRSTKPGCFRSTRRGAWAWFHDVWTCGAKVLEY
jgi:hypothetical protein